MTPAEDFLKFNPPSRLDFQSLLPPLPREFPESHPSGRCGFFLEQPIAAKIAITVDTCIKNQKSNEARQIQPARQSDLCTGMAPIATSNKYVDTYHYITQDERTRMSVICTHRLCLCLLQLAVKREQNIV